MENCNKKQFLGGRLFLAGVLVALLAGLAGAAQAQGTDVFWSQPVNLSRTGSSRDPGIAVDSSGGVHVVWQDNFAGTMYAGFDGEAWSAPVERNFPFDPATPLFVRDGRGAIAAFWITQQLEIATSYVTDTQFGRADSWSGAQVLGNSVVAFDATTDASGRLHLVYLKTDGDEFGPPGVYYRRAGGAGFAWEASQLLYDSKYFRPLEPDGPGHVDIAATQADGSDVLYAAWDDRALKRIYLAQSLDGGLSWGENQLIDGPSDDAPTADPFKLVVNAQGDMVDLVWDSGLQSGFDCTQYYQHSPDRGITWNHRQVMLADQVGCPQGNQFFETAGGLTLLMTTIQDEVFLLAWDGKMWSNPQPQGILESFVDPVNFDTVSFRCRRAMLVDGERLYVVGCDTVGDGDIWLASRQLGELSEWFPPPNVWSEPVVVASGRPEIKALEVVADEDGRFHVFWSQQDTNAADQFRTGVYYSRLDDDGWQVPVRVFSSPDHRAGHPSVTIDDRGRLVAVWSSQVSGELYFSWADRAAANNPTEWADPMQLPSPRQAVASPVIKMSATGTLNVAYAVQMNEERGIYLIHSTDGGETWSQPVAVFDAVAADWRMVTRPALFVNEQNLYLTWERQSLPEDLGVIGLYYARSSDGGKTWSLPETVLDSPLQWSELAGAADGTLYRLWQGVTNDIFGTWVGVSTDGGDTWALPANLARLGETMGPTSVVVDSIGRGHLVEIVDRQNEGEVVISHWMGAGEAWTAEDDLLLRDLSLPRVRDISLAIVQNNRLAVVYAFAEPAADGGSASVSLMYTNREIEDLPAVSAPEAGGEAAPVTTLTPSPTAEITTPEAPVEATTTPVAISTTPLADGGGLPGGAWSGLALGAGMAVLIVGITFGLAIRRARRAE
ncbi:MAG: glycoside hydrolase [Chloroflexi bacterium]|nr:glycoside hydrolase [Chloroflexota bacterium]